MRAMVRYIMWRTDPILANSLVKSAQSCQVWTVKSGIFVNSFVSNSTMFKLDLKAEAGPIHCLLCAAGASTSGTSTMPAREAKKAEMDAEEGSDSGSSGTGAFTRVFQLSGKGELRSVSAILVQRWAMTPTPPLSESVVNRRPTRYEARRG